MFTIKTDKILIHVCSYFSEYIYCTVGSFMENIFSSENDKNENLYTNILHNNFFNLLKVFHTIKIQNLKFKNQNLY